MSSSIRAFLIVSATALGLGACASQTAQPTAPTAAAPAAVKVAAPAPQCWNGDAGQFQDIGTVAPISGVSVVCEKTSDGKNAQWMTAKK